MNRIELKRKRHWRRSKSTRRKMLGTTERPRLSLFRSHKHMYGQVINDVDGKTICAASTQGKEIAEKVRYGGDIAAAKVVGEVLAQKAQAAGVKKVVFDRGGYKYHGRVKALADAARKAGLEF